jgi:murein DD-endopeptidase MepM/ murein hydrolase activator NlpD
LPVLPRPIADRRWKGLLLIVGTAASLIGCTWAIGFGAPSTRTVKQGDVFAVAVDPAVLADVSHTDDLVVRFSDREWPVFPTPDGAGVLIGVDLEAGLGAQEYVLERRNAEGAAVVLTRETVTVEKGDFGVQKLSLPDKQVDLDPDTLRRVEDEKQVMLASMDEVTPRLWDGAFLLPSEGPVQHTFGRRRVINGQPRRPHSGEDITAPTGAPVVAINHGIVRLVDDQFFSGKSIVLDHGSGLYSMYFHLSETGVQTGDRVAKNQVIGKVGSTGRVSGPHLHWGVRLNGARVNPLSLNTALNGLLTASR